MASRSNVYRSDEHKKAVGMNTNGNRFACDAPKVESRGRGNQGGLAKTVVRYDTTREHDGWNAGVAYKNRDKFLRRLNKKNEV